MADASCPRQFRGRMRLRNGFEQYPGPGYAHGACPVCVHAFVHAAAQEAGLGITQYIECAVDQAVQGTELYYAQYVLLSQASRDADIVCVCHEVPGGNDSVTHHWGETNKALVWKLVAPHVGATDQFCAAMACRELRDAMFNVTQATPRQIDTVPWSDSPMPRSPRRNARHRNLAHRYRTSHVDWIARPRPARRILDPGTPSFCQGYPRSILARPGPARVATSRFVTSPRAICMGETTGRVRWARDMGEAGPPWLHAWDAGTCAKIAQHGDVQTLQWARDHGCEWHDGTCQAAAQGGNLLVLKWARANGCEWTERTCATAATHGQVAILKWAFANGCEWPEDICVYAAEGGHVDVLQWLRTQGCVWYPNICDAAAAGGHLALLQWARAYEFGHIFTSHEDGERITFIPGTPDTPGSMHRHMHRHRHTCTAAARGGHLDVLQWLRTGGITGYPPTWVPGSTSGYFMLLNPYPYQSHALCDRVHTILDRTMHREASPFGCDVCVWDDDTCAAAAEGGHLALLQWARANGCEWSSSTCTEAARGGHLALLQWARANGCTWDIGTSFAAAHEGKLEVLCWAHEHGLEWDSGCARLAADEGHLNVLQWVADWVNADDPPTWVDWAEWGNADNPSTWVEWEDCSLAAAQGGHLDVLQWMSAADVAEWDCEKMCASAAHGGHLDVLQWLRARSCAWNALTCAGAAEGGNLGVLQWVRANGCPWDGRTVVAAADYGRHDVLLWVLQNNEQGWSEEGTGWRLEWMEDEQDEWNGDIDNNPIQKLVWMENGCEMEQLLQEAY